MTAFEKHITNFLKVLRSLEVQGIKRINPEWALKEVRQLQADLRREQEERNR